MAINNLALSELIEMVDANQQYHYKFHYTDEFNDGVKHAISELKLLVLKIGDREIITIDDEYLNDVVRPLEEYRDRHLQFMEATNDLVTYRDGFEHVIYYVANIKQVLVECEL